jgi:hypothetical protein
VVLPFLWDMARLFSGDNALADPAKELWCRRAMRVTARSREPINEEGWE